MRVWGGIDRLKEGGFGKKTKDEKYKRLRSVHKDFQGCTLDINRLGSIILALFESFLAQSELTTICFREIGVRGGPPHSMMD